MANWSSKIGSSEQFDPEELSLLNRQLFRAPAILYFALPKESTQWSVLDMGAFLQTASLSANNLGLGTVVAYEFVRYPQELAKHLNVDPNYDLVLGLGVGYEDSHPINNFRIQRRGLDDTLTIFD